MLRRCMNKWTWLIAGCAVWQFSGCLHSGVARDVVIGGLTQQLFEFLLDNNNIIDLFTDN